MLEACGVSSPEELFAHLPEAVRLNRPLDLAPGISEYEIVDYFRDRAAEIRQRLRQLPGRRRVQPLPPRAGGYRGLARRVSHLVHALPGRNLAGHPHHHLRIPDHDLPAHRHGRGQRLDVRRLHRRARSRHDGRARHRQGPRAGRENACIPNIARCCAPTPRTRACRSRSSATWPKPAAIDLEDLERKMDDLTGAVIVQIAQFLRHRGAGEGRGRNRAPARRAAGRGVHRSRLAGPSGAARRRRYRGRRAAIVRHLAELRRPLRRHHRHQGKVHPPDARPPGRPDHRFARQSRLLPDAVHPRAAHPPREGHLQHLHQPGAHRPDGHRLHDGLRQAGPARTGRAEPGQGALPGRQTEAALHRQVLQRIRRAGRGQIARRDQQSVAQKEDHRRPAAGPLLSRTGRFHAAVRHRNDAARRHGLAGRQSASRAESRRCWHDHESPPAPLARTKRCSSSAARPARRPTSFPSSTSPRWMPPKRWAPTTCAPKSKASPKSAKWRPSATSRASPPGTTPSITACIRWAPAP